MNIKTKTLTRIALIAAIYTVLTFAMFFISFGNIQYRISEALTILPLFTRSAIPGLTLGCALANFLGFLIGVNPVGLIDCLFGTAATLLAAILTYYIGKKVKNKWKYVLAPLPPVLINAVIVGIEISVIFMGTWDIGVISINMLSVLVGQFVICYGVGIPLMKILEKNDLHESIFRENKRKIIND